VTILDCSIRNMMSPAEFPETPTLGLGEAGIRIAAANLDYDEEDQELRLDLFLRFGFPSGLWRSYRTLEWALVVTFEDPSSGAAKAITLRDPFKKYENEDAENFLGLAEGHDDDGAVDGGFLKVPFRVGIDRGGDQPRLFVRASLRQYVSNTLGLDVDALSVLET
jgi:hypothetical protein